MRKRQDSNLRTALGRSTVFEAASFSHSDTLPVILLGLCPIIYFIGTLSQTLTLRAAFASFTYLLSQIPGPGRSSDDDLLNSPDPVFKGAIRACGLSIAACLPCSPTPARHLMTYLNSPNPLFKGAHQAFVRTRARGHRFAVLRPASDDALLFYWDSVPNPDTPCGLYVLHVFAVANTRTRPVV